MFDKTPTLGICSLPVREMNCGLAMLWYCELLISTSTVGGGG